MNDDYLWDGSGEPDPEVQRLERVLGKYRYQRAPLSIALASQFSWRRSSWVRYAAAAAAVLIVLGALFIFKLQNKAVTNPAELSAKQVDDQQPTPEHVTPVQKPVNPVVNSAPGRIASVATRKSGSRSYYRPREEERPLPAAETDVVAQRQPIIIPFIDVETVRHLERAQLLLRSFRNSSDSDAQHSADLSYERQRSRGLLSKNILLRRDAEAKGNMPVDELLGSLEPFLLDIANLSDRPSGEDVRSIKERMQKKEIVAALQIYSAPTLSQVF